ncbi:nitric oxide-associated protein 1 [Episyrphus balteatus]|uniref:nitric oxide-associated protein 1 n=1 Tax=Episyrphus balteatus TaxID=286459 RepID=UPI0024852678|nr:nitric oxide-associated protein 1 [Episyrphus balteatus]
MIRFNKFTKIITKIQITNLHRNYAIKKNFRLIDPNENPYDKLPAEIRSKIIFSSFLEKQKPLLGYKRKKVVEDKRQQEAERKKVQNISVKSFPLSLRALQSYKDEEEDENEDLPNSGEKTNDLEHDQVVMPKQTSERSEPPQQWMNDYEFYENTLNENGEIVSNYGTPDPLVPASRVPCNGCGAHLHCTKAVIPGYIPSEIFKGRTVKELQQIICQRCHFLKHYNIALDVEVTAETYIETLSAIKDKFALAILIVDLLDFPCSIWPGIQKILGDKRPIVVVGNKVDLLPKDSAGYLNHIKNCLKDEIVKSGLDAMNIKNVSLISAKTGYGIEELITQLQKIWTHKGDVFLVGCTNVGKSSLFNILLNSDYCKLEATDLVKKATTCPWPGTTLQMLKFPIQRPSDYRVYHRFRRLFSERAQRAAEDKLRRDQANETGSIKHATLVGRIGRTIIDRKDPADSFAMSSGSQPIVTLNENSKEFKTSHWCFDTPGVMQPEQIHNLLTTEELYKVRPSQMIAPRGFRLKRGMTLFLAGLARVDFLDGDIDSIRLPVYSSHKLPIVITPTEDASDIYQKYLGSELFGLPAGDEERLKRWPGLKPSEEITIYGESEDAATCDILLSSAGWIGIRIPVDRYCILKVWTPERRGIFIRNPSLVPYGDRLLGKRVRDSIAYRIGKPFFKVY